MIKIKHVNNSFKFCILRGNFKEIFKNENKTNNSWQCHFF